MRRKLLAGVALLLVLVVAGIAWNSYRLHHRVVGQFFDSGGVRIHYTDEGAGEPVILVHGFAVNADINWRQSGVVQALVKQYRVIALDDRGHGLSDKPHDTDRYGLEMVRDVIRLMDHLKISKAHVVGYSMGGFITLKLVTMYPDRLISATPCGAGWQTPADDGDAFRKTLGDSLEQRHDFSPLFQLLAPNGEGPGRLRMWLANRTLNSINDPLALAAVIRSLGDLSVTEEQLRANKVPVLTMVGTEDPLRLGVDRMAGVMANQTIVYIQGADHLSALNDAFIDNLKAFLDKHSESSKGSLQQAA